MIKVPLDHLMGLFFNVPCNEKKTNTHTFYVYFILFMPVWEIP